MHLIGIALFFGLGARILLDQFTRAAPNLIRDGLLIGLWQGVGFQLVYAKHAEAGLSVAMGIVGKLAVEQSVFEVDTIKSLCALVGVVLGAIGTDLLSHVLDDSVLASSARPKPTSRRHRSRSHRHHHKKTTLQPPASAGSQSVRDRAFQHHLADITSVDSNSDMIGPNILIMTPIEREVAALRARASLADSERRRYKEEKKWAVEQGNIARAGQMAWQVKRYTALMQSFHRQADAQIIEATDARSRQLQNAIDQSKERAELRVASHKPRGRVDDSAHADRQSSPVVDTGQSHRQHLRSTTRTAIR